MSEDDRSIEKERGRTTEIGASNQMPNLPTNLPTGNFAINFHNIFGLRSNRPGGAGFQVPVRGSTSPAGDQFHRGRALESTCGMSEKVGERTACDRGEAVPAGREFIRDVDQVGGVVLTPGIGASFTAVLPPDRY